MIAAAVGQCIKGPLASVSKAVSATGSKAPFFAAPLSRAFFQLMRPLLLRRASRSLTNSQTANKGGKGQRLPLYFGSCI